MNKRVEELLQSWGNDKEQVPDFFSKGIDDVLNSLPGSNIKVDEKPKRIKWLGKGLIAASVLTFGVIGSGFVSPAMAQVLKEIPIIGSIFGGSSDTSLQIIEEQGLASQLNETITYNGISLTITEAFIGGGRIAIAYTIESDDIVLQNINNEQGVPLSFDAKLNGQQFDYISEFEQSVNNGIVTGIINMNYGLSYSLIDQPTLFLNVNEIAGVQGSWNFELLLGNEATSEVTEGFAPLVSATWDDATFVVERVEFTPVQSQVIFDSTMPRQEMGLYSFNIFDENGTSLGFGGGSGGAVNELENGMVNFRETVLLPGYEEAPNGIIIEITKNKGGLADPSNYLEVKVPLHETELPHSISYSDGSKLIITGYEQLEDKTIVHYDIEGKLSLQNTFLMLTNSKGEGIIELVEPERTSLEKLSFKREFEKSEGPVTLSTSMEKVNTIQCNY
ncbi:DUF4179 domain-containing protein [Ureibacillus manganicus]|uniref:DUF4179 domain-containing protein n=1 Tax=Ureibacillus manganicus DSM 26584 TaxID=1384049 RepID=A0A0A3HZP9_9BACL|nr:DUF4179 domain-containing protein [Ureibacillus manganicus]KGR78076.1 hypothetical protein CD29_13060 [Ureibacillus manganicus DSM 26584]